MDENSHEPCDPTVADVGYRKSNVANQLPSYDTHKCCLFCVASYHFGRDALRVTVDETQDNRLGKRVSSEGSKWRRHHRDRRRKIGIDRDSAGRMAGIIFS
jgi:hypothetical protein